MKTEQRTRFEAFVAENSSGLSRTAFLLTGDPHTAQDLLQEALTRAYPKWERIEPGREFAYLRRAMVNLRTDWWRRRRYEVLTDLDAAGDGPARWDAGYDAVDDRDTIVARLAGLTARERAIVVLRFYSDLAEADVASELGISVGTVKSTCSRALARLAKEEALR